MCVTYSHVGASSVGERDTWNMDAVNWFFRRFVPFSSHCLFDTGVHACAHSLNFCSYSLSYSYSYSNAIIVVAHSANQTHHPSLRSVCVIVWEFFWLLKWEWFCHLPITISDRQLTIFDFVCFFCLNFTAENQKRRRRFHPLRNLRRIFRRRTLAHADTIRPIVQQHHHHHHYHQHSGSYAKALLFGRCWSMTIGDFCCCCQI